MKQEANAFPKLTYCHFYSTFIIAVKAASIANSGMSAIRKIESALPLSLATLLTRNHRTIRKCLHDAISALSRYSDRPRLGRLLGLQWYE